MAKSGKVGGKEADLAGGGTKSGGGAADVTKCDRAPVEICTRGKEIGI